MRIDPAIVALRADRGMQRRAQTAMVAAFGEWRAEPGVAEALAELERFGAGAELEKCAVLNDIFTEHGGAERLAGSLCDIFANTLIDEPFGHPAFRHGFDGRTATLLLAQAGRAQLVLQARMPGETEFDTANFSDALRFEAVLAGKAEARIVRHDGPTPDAGLCFESISLGKGARLALDLGSEALQVMRITQTLVSLRLHRFAEKPEPSRELSLADGALLHQAAGSIRTSRQEMMLALLGRMGRAEAAPLMADMARERGDTSMRWQALRECLALDTATGFSALVDIARRGEDPLGAPAGALRASLIEAHPQLMALENN